MIIFKSINKLNKEVNFKAKIGFVPTMGALHKGHISLIKYSKKVCEKTIVSVFINPSQFNKINDFRKYPKKTKKDISILKKLKVDYLLSPESKEVYRNKKYKKIKLTKKNKIMCAYYRPGHFEGVLGVINQFLLRFKPQYIFFGEKDYQQLFLIKTFIKKKYSTKIVNCKTIRNKSGFALSTRNKLLNNKELILGSKVYKIIKKFKKKINYSNYKKIINNLKKDIYALGISKIEYLSLIDIDRNIYFNKNSKKYKLFIAYYINKIRFIDNI